MNKLTAFFHRLGDAEYLHLLLEPLPRFGVLFGLIFFGVSFATKNPRLRIIALLVIAGSCMAYYPYLYQRQASTPQMSAVSELNAAIQQRVQERISERWYYYGTAILALLAIFVRKGKIAPVVLATAVIGGVVVIFLSSLAHLRDAETFHPNIPQQPETKIHLPIPFTSS